VEDSLSEFFAKFLDKSIADPLAVALVAIIVATLLVSFMALSAMFSVWLERKVSGRIQDRLGPTRVGGKFGWLQGLADGIKLITKEDVLPGSADHILFRLGPYIAMSGAFLAYLAMPFANGWAGQVMSIGVFFMLAVMSTEVFGIILAGYGSGSKWSLFGGMREAAQMVSYEVPMAICVLIPVIVAGTMNLNETAKQQGGMFWNWYVFHDPFTFAAFWLYFCCATSQCKRAPFDLAEAESELVAGFHTEYSGIRWMFFFIAEYGAMVAVSGIAILQFLGGWNTGLLPWDLSETFLGLVGGNLLNVVVFIAKCWIMVFVMIWVRWTLPRLRIDQVMMACLKYFLPISCVLLLGVSLWQLALPHVVVGGILVLNYVPYVAAGACLLGLVLVIAKMVTTNVGLPQAQVATPFGHNRPITQGFEPASAKK
jgi:NADH-quinone oxidoreductase subunit H